MPWDKRGFKMGLVSSPQVGSATEGCTVLYPSQLHPHPLFTCQGNAGPSIRNRSLELHHAAYGSRLPFTPQQSWPPYDNPLNYSYPPYPSPSPFPAPRLSPPQVYLPINFKSSQNNSGDPTSSQNHCFTLTGSLDLSTGIFYHTPEHPWLRIAQACEKCRTRKAKCSGEHPACKHRLARGLLCEYAKEGRVRGPNKAKSKPSNGGNDTSSNAFANIRNGPWGRISSVESSHSPYQPRWERHIQPQKNATAVQMHSLPLRLLRLYPLRGDYFKECPIFKPTIWWLWVCHIALLQVLFSLLPCPMNSSILLHHIYSSPSPTILSGMDCITPSLWQLNRQHVVYGHPHRNTQQQQNMVTTTKSGRRTLDELFLYFYIFYYY